MTVQLQLVAACIGAAICASSSRTKFREPVLLACSLAFSALLLGWWMLGFVAAAGLVFWAAHRGLDRVGAAAVVVALLIPLFAAKFHAAAVGPLLGPSVFVPLGMSFFVFQQIGYLVDVRRNTVSAETNFARYLTFSFLLPVRMCGPILRYRPFARSLRRSTTLTAQRVLAAFVLIAVGLLKKRLLGDWFGDSLAGPSWQSSDVASVTAMFARIVSVYGDASGYADIAEGLAALCGIAIPTSFAQPLTKSLSIGEFWRRWQLPIMGWFRDFVYRPVRELRGGRSVRLALFASFLASSLWHGLQPTWLVWGIVTAAVVIADERLGAMIIRLPKALRWPTRAVRNLAKWAYLAALMTLLSAASAGVFGHLGALFQGPLLNRSLWWQLCVALVAVAALVVSDRWLRIAPLGDRPVTSRLIVTARVVLVVAGCVALLWSTPFHHFVYQRF